MVPKLLECPLADISITLYRRSDAHTNRGSIAREFRVLNGEPSCGYGECTESRNWRFSPLPYEVSNVKILNFTGDTRR